MPTELSISVAWIKPAVTAACFAIFWSWESFVPFFAPARDRLRHAGRNLAIAVVNTVALGLFFATATVMVAEWAATNRFGLLHRSAAAWPARLVAAVLLLDAWLYLWHRASHRIPVLWRFHRMHHADDAMDVTTATRFHLGEHVGSSVLRLGLIPLLGFEMLHLLAYETLVVGITMFHHANISLGRWDAPLRWLIVTPFMHKVHHSRLRTETDSNYSTLFSFWDRLFRSFRMRMDCAAIDFGLDEFDDPKWQTMGGMLKTPFRSPTKADRP